MAIRDAQVNKSGEVFAIVDGFTRRLAVFSNIEAAQRFADKVNDLGKVPNEY